MRSEQYHSRIHLSTNLSESCPRPKGSDNVQVPYSSIAAFQGQASPFFNEGHKKFMYAVREFVARELMPIAQQNDQKDVYPDAELKVWTGSGQS